MKHAHTTTYRDVRIIIRKAAKVAGKSGWDYELETPGGECLGHGWTAGRIQEAEKDAREHVDSLDSRLLAGGGAR